ERQRAVEAVILEDPAVESLNSYIGGGSFNGVSTGYVSLNLKPESEHPESSEAIIDRLRPKLEAVYGIKTSLYAVQDLQIGGRVGKARYQYTLQDADLDELNHYVPIVHDKLEKLPELEDVSTDQQISGLQATLEIDRDAAGRLGVSSRLIDNTLY